MRKTLAAALIFAGRDRACLTGVPDRYLKAMAANDSKKAPLAPNITYTENPARLPLNEGWPATVNDNQHPPASRILQ